MGCCKVDCSNPSLTLGWSWLADSSAVSLLVLGGLFLLEHTQNLLNGLVKMF